MDYDVDDVYAFFINCYHLKDWIIHDETLELQNKKAIVEEYVHHTNNNCLDTCGLICNGLKHLIPGKPEFAGKHFEVKIFEFMREDTKEKYEQNPTITSIKFNMDTSDGIKDAFTIATDCMTVWEKFITEMKL